MNATFAWRSLFLPSPLPESASCLLLFYYSHSAGALGEKHSTLRIERNRPGTSSPKATVSTVKATSSSGELSVSPAAFPSGCFVQAVTQIAVGMMKDEIQDMGQQKKEFTSQSLNQIVPEQTPT